MARPLKYKEGKTSVRNITIPDSMWEALPSPKSQWVVEAVRQFQELPNRAEGGAGETEDRGVPMNVATPSALIRELDQALKDVPEPIRSEVPPADCTHPKPRLVNVIGGKRCLDCWAMLVKGTWVK
jgi:hypothetical protein